MLGENYVWLTTLTVGIITHFFPNLFPLVLIPHRDIALLVMVLVSTLHAQMKSDMASYRIRGKDTSLLYSNVGGKICLAKLPNIR